MMGQLQPIESVAGAEPKLPLLSEAPNLPATPAPTTAAFYTNSNLSPIPSAYRYCFLDITDTLKKVDNSIGTISSFFINSVSVPNRAFDPNVSPAVLGSNIVRHTITNVHGCQNSLTKTKATLI